MKLIVLNIYCIIDDYKVSSFFKMWYDILFFRNFFSVIKFKIFCWINWYLEYFSVECFRFLDIIVYVLWFVLFLRNLNNGNIKGIVESGMGILENVIGIFVWVFGVL